MQKVHLAENLADPDMGLRKMRRKLEPWQGEKGAGQEEGGEGGKQSGRTLTLRSEEFPALLLPPSQEPLLIYTAGTTLSAPITSSHGSHSRCTG